MLIVGLTGGMGSGKSLISSIFKVLDIPTYNADKEARLLTESSPEIARELFNWLGSGYFEQGSLIRQKVAELVFADPTALVRLNEIIHPRIMNHFAQWASNQKATPYVLHEAAILFESGFYKMMDTNILVVCPEQIRIDRVASRDGIASDQVKARILNQWPDEKKIPLADYIITNDGLTPVLPRVLSLHNQLIQMRNGKI